AECPGGLGGRPRRAPEPAEETGARGGQEVIAAQRRGLDTVECSDAGRRSLRQADRYRSVQLDHRRWRDVGELPVKVDDPRPVRRLPPGRVRVTGGDGGLALAGPGAVHGPRAIEP